MTRTFLLFALLFSPLSGQAETTTACAPDQVLSVAEQAALLVVDREFTALYLDGDTPRQFGMKITTPGAFTGAGFPSAVCGAHVVFTFEDGRTSGGVMTYRANDPQAEHRSYEYTVTFPAPSDARLIFSTTHNGIIWGFAQMPEVSGFFTGANVGRWE